MNGGLLTGPCLKMGTSNFTNLLILRSDVAEPEPCFLGWRRSRTFLVASAAYLLNN